MRVISATNHSLPDMVSLGLFREDLYYRLNLIPIHLPPLRERREDIPLLVRHFAKDVPSRAEFSSEAVEYLSRLPWPGNIRELKNVVERALIMAPGGTIGKDDIARCMGGAPEPSAARSSGSLTLEELEKERIRRALSDCNGNMTRAAASLGITRASLYRRLEKYKIETPA